MQFRPRATSFFRLCFVVLLAASGACADTSPGGPPATVAEAAKTLDLSTFPVAKGVKEPNYQKLAGLSYNAPGTVNDVFEFQRKQLGERKWKELPGGYTSDQSCSATFSKNGYSLSVMVSPIGNDGEVMVSIMNLGNVKLSKLPVPEGAKSFYDGPANTMYITEAAVEPMREACQKLLVDKGWVRYGSAGDVQDFKQNAIRLSARVTSAPAQGGKTIIDYSTQLMSADLPAPADVEQLRYADSATQLFFDTPLAQQEVVDYYRQTLAKSGWESTTENLVNVDFKKIMIFRNPEQELLELELTEVDDKTRVLIEFQSAAEVAEMERRIDAEIKRRKAEQQKPAESAHP